MSTTSRRQASGNYATTVDVWVRSNDDKTVESIVITVLTEHDVTSRDAEREAMDIAIAQVRDEGSWGGVFAASARPVGAAGPRAAVAS